MLTSRKQNLYKMYRLIKENVEREVNSLASLSLLIEQGYKLIEENKVEENENTEVREIELTRNENVNFEENFQKIVEEIEAKKEEEIEEETIEIEEEKPKKRGRKKGE